MLNKTLMATAALALVLTTTAFAPAHAGDLLSSMQIKPIGLGMPTGGIGYEISPTFPEQDHEIIPDSPDL